MGYDFSQAVADVIDNSIEAQATVVTVDLEFDGDDSWVRIADNGHGMRADALREALRYGAEREYDDADLGKFGLGLKTASMSQCARLSVASRWNPERADVAAYVWDLEHISRTNRWEILPIDRNGLGPEVRTPLKDTTGTVVLWQRLDRILGYRHPYGEAARRRFSQMARELELHLGMVFHRFLSGEVGRRRKLRILINGHPVEPWDPFCRGEAKTKELTAVDIEVEHEGVTGRILLQPYVLPHQDDFSSPAAFERASGPGKWNQQQGFYVYRADRMIQSGGWSHLRAPDEHTKLARIAVSFAPKLDEAFKVNVAKMRVQMPASARDSIREAVGPVVSMARQAYDRKTRTGGRTEGPGRDSTGRAGPHGGSNRATGARAAGAAATGLGLASPGTAPERTYTAAEWRALMMASARAGERSVIEAVLSRVAAGEQVA